MTYERHGGDEHDPARSSTARIVRFPTAGAHDEAASPGMREVMGDVLRDERRAQGRTLADVAEHAAVSLPYLSEVERGRKDVSSEVLTAITTALGVDVAEVLERTAHRLRAVAPVEARHLRRVGSPRVQRGGSALLLAA